MAEAILKRTHLVVQAGTGKSLAYLVPAALSGKKVVVATATTTRIRTDTRVPPGNTHGLCADQFL